MRHGIVIHGGAGTILKSAMTPKLENEYKEALISAINEGYIALDMGKSSIDACIIAVKVLEDFPLFNAGKGSVYNHEGEHDMDASIMNGSDLMAGSISGVRNIKNPIELAADIMLHSDHVYLTGKGAEDFGKVRNIAFAPDEYFHSAFRYQQYQHALKNNEVFLDHSDQKFGTVGAVAIDKNGTLCAATSTGGMTNKKYGRVGDSALIGAGTYANNETCAVSCTGDGEYFIRAITAYELSALIEHKGLDLKSAGDELIHNKMMKIGGEGGLISIDKKGNYILPFNCSGMYRGVKMSDETMKVGIYEGWLTL